MPKKIKLVEQVISNARAKGSAKKSTYYAEWDGSRLKHITAQGETVIYDGIHTKYEGF